MANANLNDKLVAAVRIRGTMNVRAKTAETLKRLNLKRVNNMTLIKVNDSYSGMLKMCNDYIAYGEITEDMLGKVFARYKIKANPKDIMAGKLDEIKELLPFGLHPPKHGFRSTSLNVNQGGDLGYQGEKINALIKRMV